jgi:hypothetical protein
MDRELGQLGCRRRWWVGALFWQVKLWSRDVKVLVFVQNSLPEWKKPNCKEVVLW